MEVTELTDIDPFEDATVDDTDVAPFEAPAPKKAAPKKAAVKADPDSEGKLTVTLKGGAGFDAPWIVVHAGSVDDALEVFQADATKLASLMDRVQAAGKYFVGLAPAKPASGSGGAPARPGAEAPAGTPTAPGPDWTYKSGVNAKTGKTWKAWMPPRGSDDPPVWL
jgi:hypothetical protein